MALVLYNSLGRKPSKFKPLSRKRVTMYTCGPTVYNYAHIGNFRYFVFVDLLRRYLSFKGYKVEQVMNITDVEDRIIDGIKSTGKGLKELTGFYTAAFMEDLQTLNIQPAERYPRATEHIAEMVAAVKTLMKKGFAYKAEDGSIYFSLAKFPRYGRLSGIKPHKGKKAARTSEDHYDKLGANDFALWKAWVPDDGDVFWETELGKGRPGWHIECSVMAMKYLGKTLDIHAGGLDLRFPHHENEIAQSEALTGKTFVRHWEHSGLLTMEGGKMSKSVGNIVTLRELLGRGLSPRAIRFFLITAHYRDELKLTDGSLEQAAATVPRFDRLLRRLESAGTEASSNPGYRRLAKGLLSAFEQAMDSDLNVPRALASFFVFERRLNSMLDASPISRNDADLLLAALRRVDSVLGVMGFEGPAATRGRMETEQDAEVEALIAQREEARGRKDFGKADQIREHLRTRGIVIEDTPKGTVWRRLSTPT